MSTTTYLISGASRGLGLETARQLLALSTSNRIIAACRSPETANDLQELIQANPGRIEAVAIDVGDADTIKVSATRYLNLSNRELSDFAIRAGSRLLVNWESPKTVSMCTSRLVSSFTPS